MSISEENAKQSFQKGRAQSEIEPSSSGVDLRLEIKPAPLNLDNRNSLAEIFPCK